MFNSKDFEVGGLFVKKVGFMHPYYRVTPKNIPAGIGAFKDRKDAIAFAVDVLAMTPWVNWEEANFAKLQLSLRGYMGKLRNLAYGYKSHL